MVNLTFGAKPTFSIERLSQGLSGSAIGVTSTGSPIPPGQVVIDLASGYSAGAPPPGTTVGTAFLASASGSGTGATIALIGSDVVADDPGRYAGDPASQACAPGPYTAVWRLSTTVFGLSYTLAIFVGHPAGQPQNVELTFCPQPLTGSDGKPVTPAPVPLTGATFLLSTLVAPTTSGDYVSHAFVSSESVTGTPDPSSTVEARFLDHIPYALTLKGRYDATSREAVLTGRVTALGRPQPNVTVDVSWTDSLLLSKQVRTSASGTFSTRIRITRTMRFAADVPDSTGGCPGPSTAPRGCASQTVAGTALELARVVVPKSH